MAEYINLNDLMTKDSEADLIDLTSPGGTSVDAGVVMQAIASAQAEVDTYIGGRVRLPLADGEVSAAVKHFTLLVARYYLYADRKTEAVIAEYERAVQWMRDVAAGKASTGVVQPALPEDISSGSSVFAPVRKPLFGADFERLYDVPMGPNGSGSVW